MVKKKKRNLTKTFIDVGKATVIGTTLTGTLGAIPGGGSIAASGQAGIQNVFSFVPIAGTAIGAGLVLNVIQDLEPKKRKKKIGGGL